MLDLLRSSKRAKEWRHSRQCLLHRRCYPLGIWSSRAVMSLAIMEHEQYQGKGSPPAYRRWEGQTAMAAKLQGSEMREKPVSLLARKIRPGLEGNTSSGTGRFATPSQQYSDPLNHFCSPVSNEGSLRRSSGEGYPLVKEGGEKLFSSYILRKEGRRLSLLIFHTFRVHAKGGSYLLANL